MIGLTNDDIDRFRSVVAQRLGLVLDHSHLDDVAEVLRQRIRETASGDAATYFARLDSAGSQADEIQKLADALTVGETHFFRHPGQYQAFAEIALPERLDQRGQGALRILSAGCASGEEPYSLAVLVAEALAGRQRREVEILGIDVSPALVERAVRARYSEWSLRATSLEQRQRYFRMKERDYVLDDAVRGMARFEVRNLMEDDPGFWRPETFDIIFFRNVSIYFAPQTTRTIIERMSRSLMPGGFLFLGPSETLRGVSNDFHLLHSYDAFYYQRRRTDERATHPSASTNRTASLPGGLLPPFPHQPDESWMQAIHRAAQRIAAVTGQPADQKASSGGNAAGASRSREAAPPAPAGPQGGEPAPPWDLGPVQELLRQERFEEAIAALGALPAESAADRDALLLRAAVLTNRGDVKQAEEACRQVLQLDEMNAGAHYLLALCQEHAGERHLAVEHDQTAIYLDPLFAMPHLHLGMMTRRCGDLSTARHELQQALTLLERELTSRIPLFGGGFNREALVQLCRAELRSCGGSP